MSKRTNTSVVVMATAVALTATACGSGDGSSDGKEKPKIGFAISALNQPFMVQMKKGAEEEAKAQGAELSVQNASDDASQQANQIQNFTSQQVKSIIINPVDSDAAAPSVKAANNAKIPVIAADRSVNKADIKTTVASDNVAGGEKAAKEIADQLDGKGQVLWLQGQTGTSASRERGKGFKQGLKEYPGIKVVTKQPADFQRTKGLDVTTNAMQSHPEIDAVFAENDEMALGAVKALGSKAGKSVKIVGFDGTGDAMKAIKKGTINATVAQQPTELGKMAVRNAMRVIDGSTVDKQIKVPVKVVTKKNVDRFS
ncbi:ribose transport system permease protein [Streptomyces qinglanensis]|uniref:Ribose transport system permease protein n=1 Tax=Streptomyces qinglanensis TaxID=943816 RepID=A0A1H9UG46_9ACTN|nr:substrate-binding domain-containing protein [Streptomyces qinglanensis]SES08241.1 ribose transport system permease protein [Streptomyces qinglanensis]